jgi:hypothetical protein
VNENQDQATKFLRELSDAATRNPVSAALLGIGAAWFFGERAWRGGVRPAIDAASEVAQSAVSRVSASGKADKFDLTELFRQQPLALGVIGVAIGAGLAAALPTTQVEAQFMGEASDELKTRARELAAEGADRAQDAAKRALEAAADEAERQGLTPEGLKSVKDKSRPRWVASSRPANQGISGRG